MSLIYKFVKDNPKATVRDIVFHLETELEIGEAKDVLALEASKVAELMREKNVAYAKLREVQEQAKEHMEPYAAQADEAVSKETGKKSTKEGREKWVEAQLREDEVYQRIKRRIEGFQMDIVGIDIRSAELESETKRAKYNYRMFETMVSALRLMVDHKETVIN